MSVLTLYTTIDLQLHLMFSVGQTAQLQTCSIIEKPHTGLDDCLNMLLSCFREKLSVSESGDLGFYAVVGVPGAR